MNKRSQPRIWTTRTYDRLSGCYDTLMRIFFPVGERGRERVVEKLGPGSVLDLACGTGTLLEMASNKGLKCYGIDISGGMLAQARRKVPDAEIRQPSYYEIPYPDNCFDHVVATNALSGGFVDARKALSEMIRACRHGGGVHIAEWPRAPKAPFTEL